MVSTAAAGWLAAALWLPMAGCAPPGPEPSEAPPQEQAAAADATAAAADAAADPAAPPAAKPITHADLHLGIDVSSHSGEVDWTALRAAGHTFAFLKATEGVDLRDPAFELEWPKVKEAGLLRGAYHFYVSEDDPEEQARFFISTVTLESGDLAPVVDIELLGHNTPPGLADRLETFVQRLEEHYGVAPIIYTDANFWDQNLDDRFGDHPLWIAEYGVAAPRLPTGWSEWHLWQWRGDAQVPGVAKGADLSKVNREGADLSRLVIP
jgi:lysozyme